MELDERIDELELRIDEERTDEDEERNEDEGMVLDDGLELDEGRLDDVATLPQIDPVTAGVSIAPPLAFTCTPNDTFCPG